MCAPRARLETRAHRPDLARALGLTADEFGGQLDGASGPWRSDFLAVNRVLAETMPEVERELFSGGLRGLDEARGDEDDGVSMWGIERAREFACSTAQAQWAVRGTPIEHSLTSALDRAFATSSILILRRS